MRILATFCFSFAAGTALAQYALPPEFLLAAVAAATLCAILSRVVLKEERRLRALLITLGLALSFLHSFAYHALVFAPNDALVGTEQTFTMELCSKPEETAYGARAEVRILDDGLHGRAMYYGEEELLDHAPGEKLTARVSCNSAVAFGEEPDDEFTTFTSRGIFLLLYNEGEEHYEAGNAAAWRYLPQRMAQRFALLIDENFPERSAAFFRALLLGDRTQMSLRDKSNLSEAGLYHITAVSGLHCGFLLAVAVFLIGRKYAKTLCAFTVTLLLLYTLLTGASPSTVRASIMLSMVVIAPLCNRETDGATSLAFSLFLILLFHPHAIASVSLQLSYAAVGGIMWVTPKAMCYVGGHGRAIRMMLSSFAVTLGACIFTLPLCAFYFGRISLVMFLSNLLCLGVVSASFVTGFLAVLVSIICPPLGGLIADLAALGAEYTLGMAEVLASTPYHALYFSHPANVTWLCYVYALIALCIMFRRTRYRIGIAAGLIAASLLFTIACTERSFHSGALHIVVLDVEQGQSILLMRDDYAAVIDCGSSNSYINAGEIAADYLLTAGHRDVDALILTHCDDDHINGVEQLSVRLGIEDIYISESDALPEEAAAIFAAVGMEPTAIRGASRVEDAAFSVELYRSNIDNKRSNDHGLAAKISYHDFSFLVTGDMSAAAEKQLMDDYSIREVDALLVGHHGSAKATDRNVLRQLSPSLAVVSVGENSYGHPAKETLYRLSDVNTTVYRTDLQGNIHIKVN